MRRPYLIVLGLILLIGIFFRTYQLVERFHFAHDDDLYSWIVKDILVNHHYRLIGQLTSAPGIFIGPAYYYSLIPFFLIFNMDPVAATVPITIFGILTIISYYFVFSRLFNIKVGLIASFLYTVLINNIEFDRRIVPSTPANLWVIWYFFTIVMIARGKFAVLPLLGILIALIWHIHIALIPALIAIIAAFLVSRKLPNKKQVLSFFISLFITSLPLILFEVRHNFSQTLSLISNFTTNHGGRTGSYKLMLVLEMITKNINSLFLSPQSLPNPLRYLFVILLLSLTFFVVKKSLLSKKELIPLSVWMVGVVCFFTLSSSLISEYYFYSIEVIFTLLVSLTFYQISKSSNLGKILILSLLTVIGIKNLIFYTTTYIYHKGYVEKKALVEYIVSDAKDKGYPCVGINYITTPGENVGFRYFFYLKNLHLVHPSTNIPVYNIVIPDELSLGEVKQKFGHIGLIPPTKIPSKEVIEKSCQAPNTNLTDLMFGYVE